MSELVAKPLRYLIALEHGGQDNAITELGYDASGLPTQGIGAHYANLRDEKNSGRYAPYLPPDDIDSEYGEPAPDPAYPGFWENLETQLRRIAEQGYHYVELDNLDTYDVATALRCFDRCGQNGLEVFVKNPALVRGGEQATLLSHQAAALVIVEEECGLPTRMNELRQDAGRPQMPIRFVSYGSIDTWAHECANIIQARGYMDMGVTHSDLGEYASSRDVLLPSLPSAAERPTVTITTTGDVLVMVNGVPI
jgi:hypothetical protein